jgi:putative transposase
MIPNDFPRWPTVYYYFRKWCQDGTWERINRSIRERLRVRLKRDPQPSAGIVDSQSVKTTGVGGEERGYDGGKKIDGRKRHLLVDTEGFVLKAKVHSAKIMDYEGIKLLLEQVKERFSRLSHLWLDAGGYRGEGNGGEWVKKKLGWTVDLVERPRKLAPEEILRRWASEWAKEGVKVDWQKLMPTIKASAGVTSSMGGRALFWLDLPQPEDEQRLREAVCEWRGVRICCPEPPYGKAVSPPLRPFQPVSPGN